MLAPAVSIAASTPITMISAKNVRRPSLERSRGRFGGLVAAGGAGG